MVTRVIDGRTHRLALRPETLAEAADGSRVSGTRWERLFDVVGDYLEERKEMTEPSRAASCESSGPSTRPSSGSSRPGPARRCCGAGSTGCPAGRRRPPRSTSGSGAASASSCAIPTAEPSPAPTGEYTVVDPPHRLVFTWVWDDQPDRAAADRARVHRAGRQDDGADDEQRIPTDERLRVSERGWHVCYDNLERLLAG